MVELESAGPAFLAVALRSMFPPDVTLAGLALKAETTRSGLPLLPTVTWEAAEQLLVVVLSPVTDFRHAPK